jgi:hypothetical protein
MRKTFRAFVILFALCVSAYAGETPNPPGSPNSQRNAMQEPITDGDMQCPLTEVALILLNTLLPIL